MYINSSFFFYLKHTCFSFMSLKAVNTDQQNKCIKRICRVVPHSAINSDTLKTCNQHSAISVCWGHVAYINRKSDGDGVGHTYTHNNPTIPYKLANALLYLSAMYIILIYEVSPT